MANYDVNAWESLKLIKCLKEKNQYIWYDIKQQLDKVAPLLTWRPIGLEEYTDHDINHCFRVLRSIGDILPQDFKLSTYELEILIYSVVFHDIGMWTRKGEVENCLSDDDFMNYFKSQNSYDRITDLIYSSSSVDKNLGFLLLRPVVANYHRSHHPQRSADILNSMSFDNILDSRITKEKLRIIAIICAAHGWALNDVLTSDLLDIERLSENVANEPEEDILIDVRLLAFLVRIGDLLDLNSQRISNIVRRYLEPLSAESEAHWKMHEWLHFKNLNPNIIQIKGNFNYDRFGSTALDSYNLALSWCNYLQQDINALKKALQFPEKFGMKKGRKLGELLLDVSEVKSEGIIFSDKLTFTMDKQRIMEILGDEIYDDKSAFVRELIQNAVDATRTKMVDDYRKGVFPNYSNLDLRTPNSWPRELTSRNDYAIHISTGTTTLSINGNNQKLLYFEIKDNGIGMSISQIKDYFLQIGKSYYQSKEFSSSYQHSSISRFGIGFLTCLIIAKRIEIYTKSEKDGEGIKIVMSGEDNLISAIKDDTITSYGTKVIIYCDPEIVSGDGWLPTSKYPNDLYKLIHSGYENETELKRAVSYWIPWSEFTLYINDEKREHITPFDLSKNEQYWSIPFYLLSADNHEKLATGIFVSLKQRIIPRFESIYSIQNSYLPSIGGITIPPWEENKNSLTYIDVFRQPSSIITASRRAKFLIPSENARKEIDKRLILAIDDLLSKNYDDIGFRAIFRASVNIDIDDFELLLPVIRDRKLSWEYWDEKRFRQNSCILVPFFLPLAFSNLSHELPIVGVPRRNAFGPCQQVPKIENISVVPLNNMVSGALNAPSYFYSSDCIEEGYTFVLYRLCEYIKRIGKWNKVADSMAIQTPIRNHMCQWDIEEKNPWIKYGFDSSSEDSWFNVRKYFHKPKASFSSIAPIEIKISPKEWNHLDRREEDSSYKILIPLLLHDCE